MSLRTTEPTLGVGGASRLGIPTRIPLQSGIRGAARTVESAGGFLEWVGAGGVGQAISQRAGQVADALETDRKTFLEELGEAAGSSAVFFIPGFGLEAATAKLATIGPRLATWLGVGTSAFLESATEAGSVYQESLRRGRSAAEASTAAMKTFWGNLPAIATANVLGPFGRGGVAQRAIKSMASEGLQEFTQQVISNVALHDPILDGAFKAAGIGGIIGGGTAVITVRPEVPSPPRTADELVPPPGAGVTVEAVAQSEPLPPPPEAFEEPVKVAKPGALSTVTTERGTEVETRYAIVGASALVPSHDVNLRTNPSYPAELQPRDRGRIASENQINNIVLGLDPAQLGESRLASMGSPIVGPDLVVESGNGRVIAMLRAYRQYPEKAKAYQSWLASQAEKYGITKKDMEDFDDPILVRIRETPVNRAQFAREANEQTTAAMSATEQALNDAQRMTGPLLEAFVPDEAGNVAAASNRAFLQTFMDQVVSPTDRGRYVTAQGTISQEGITRVKNAIFAKAYGDTQAVSLLSENPDNNVRNMTHAMLLAAPRVAAVREAVKQGQLHPLDMSVEITDAMTKLSSLRNEGRSVEEYLNQQTLTPSLDLSDESRLILATFDKYKRSTRTLADILLTYTDLVEGLGGPQQTQLFAQPVPSRSELWRASVRQVVPELQVAESEPAYTTNLFTGAIEPVRPPVDVAKVPDLRPPVTEVPVLQPIIRRARKSIEKNGQASLFEYEHQRTPKKYPEVLKGLAVNRGLEQTGWWRASGTHIHKASDLVDMFYNLKEAAREKLFVVSLDEHNKILGMEWIGVGSLTASVAHPREMLKGALALGAKKIAWGHNHPSHELVPSPDDIDISDRLELVANQLGIEVAYNVIVEGDKFYLFGRGVQSYQEPTSTSVEIPVFETTKRFTPIQSGVISKARDLTDLVKHMVETPSTATVAVMTDAKNRTINIWTLAEVTPQEVLRLAIENDASAVALVSNGPISSLMQATLENAGIRWFDNITMSKDRAFSERNKTSYTMENLPLYEGETAKDLSSTFDKLRRSLDITQVDFDDLVSRIAKHHVWSKMTDEQLSEIRKAMYQQAKKKLFRGHPYQKQMQELIRQATEEAEAQELTAEDVETLGLNKNLDRTRQSSMKSRNEARRQILGPLRLRQASIEDIKRRAVAYAQQHLAPSDRGTLLNVVKNAKTQRDLILAFFRVEHLVNQRRMAYLRSEIMTLYEKAIGSPSVAVDYQQTLQGVMSAFDPKSLAPETRKKLEAAEAFFNRRQAEGQPVEIPLRLLKTLNRLKQTPLRKLPLPRLQALRDEVAGLIQLGRVKQRVRQSVNDLEKASMLQSLVAGTIPLNRKALERTQPGETLTLAARLANRMKRLYNFGVESGMAITPVDVMLDTLDGGEGTYDGPNHRTFKQSVDAKFSDYLTEKAVYKERMFQMAKDLNLTDKDFELITVYATARQEGGIEKLQASGVDPRLYHQPLTPPQMRLYKAMREDFESVVPALESYMKEVENRPFQRVQDYFPFLMDFELIEQEPVIERVGTQSQESTVRTKQLEKGFTKPRVGGKRPIQLNAMTIYTTHIDNALYLIHMGKTVRQLFEVANRPEYRQASGDLGQKFVLDYLDTLARKGGAAGQKQIRALDSMRYRVGVATLGANLMTGFIQITSLPNSVALLGAPAVMRGVARVADPGWRKFLRKFPELRIRVAGDPAFQDERVEGQLSNKSFAHIQYLDAKVAAVTVAAAYEQYLLDQGQSVTAEDLERSPDPKAMAHAQFILRRSQTSGLFKDVPQALSRGTLTGNRSVDKMLLQFQNYALNTWSLIQHDVVAANLRTNRPARAAEMMLWIFASMSAAAGFRMSFNYFLDAMMGRTRKEEDNFWFEVFEEFLQAVPFVGQIYSGFRYSSAPVPALKLAQDLFETERGALGPAIAATKLAGVPGTEQAAKILRRLNPKGEQLLVPPVLTGPIIQPPLIGAGRAR